jgi:cell division protein FtsB
VPLNNVQIILIALLVVGLRLMIDFSTRIIEGQNKVKEQRALEMEISDLLADQRELEAQKAYFSSDTFVEEWAHSDGKMVRSGERLVIPIYEAPPSESEQGATQTPAPPPTVPAWHVWWSLFFDGPPPLTIANPVQ